MPEWQGAGVGLRFLNWVCNHHVTGNGRWGDRVKAAYFHTSHPGLAAALRRDSRWIQLSARLHGDNKARSAASMRKSPIKKPSDITAAGYGGHFRAVRGSRYNGPGVLGRSPFNSPREAS